MSSLWDEDHRGSELSSPTDAGQHLHLKFRILARYIVVRLKLLEAALLYIWRLL